MKITAYAVGGYPPKIVPAPLKRPIFDAYHDEHPYRCLPLNIGSKHQWWVECPGVVEVTWNGGTGVSDLQVRGVGEPWNTRPIEHFARSNFAHGIVTFHVDYIWQLEENWNLMYTGPSNYPKINAYPLTGIFESLPYTATMNWKLMQPGTVRFEQGEPYCAIMPVPKPDVGISDCKIEVRSMAEAPEINRQHAELARERDDLMRRMAVGDAATLREPWGKRYFRGVMPDGTRLKRHTTSLKLQEVEDLRQRGND